MLIDGVKLKDHTKRILMHKQVSFGIFRKGSKG